ncbi:hypothetical protein [Chryseobacterium sp. AG363]|uniref:hypothetical protein n=1 Tax=Chryseobacterium sp. AG363 TaxID=2183997 RepID=UPI0011C23C0F|nr:hypothetical protein [Chryseobacterium sp. AG363]
MDSKPSNHHKLKHDISSSRMLAMTIESCIGFRHWLMNLIRLSILTDEISDFYLSKMISRKLAFLKSRMQDFQN